jgi:hypothetical protein
LKEALICYLFVIADHVIVEVNAETREAGARGKVEVKLRAAAQEANTKRRE